MSGPGAIRVIGSVVGVLAAAALAVLCCAGGPLFAAGLVCGAAAVAGFLGAGGGVVVLLAVAAALLAFTLRRARRHRDGQATAVQVQLLYTDGCPNAEAYAPRLRALLADEGINAPVRRRLLTSDEQARQEQFLGSPTVRINGRDVDPAAQGRLDYGLSCRLYSAPDGLRGTPPDEWITDALRETTPLKRTTQ